jgi:hypothetical protein
MAPGRSPTTQNSSARYHKGHGEASIALLAGPCRSICPGKASRVGGSCCGAARACFRFPTGISSSAAQRSDLAVPSVSQHRGSDSAIEPAGCLLAGAIRPACCDGPCGLRLSVERSFISPAQQPIGTRGIVGQPNHGLAGRHFAWLSEFGTDREALG